MPDISQDDVIAADIAADIVLEATTRGTNKFKIYKERYPDLKERILIYIKGFDNVTFNELSQLAGEEHRGNIVLSHKYKNTILWDGMSKTFAEAVGELIDEKKIFFKRVGSISQIQLTYAMDGSAIAFPVAKKIYPYKSPRWFPVIFTAKST